jgi:hypothetical protein
MKNLSIAPTSNLARDPAQKAIVGDEVQNSENPLYLGEKTNRIVPIEADKTGGAKIRQKHFFDMTPIIQENQKISAHGTAVFADAERKAKKNDISLPETSSEQNLKYIHGMSNT